MTDDTKQILVELVNGQTHILELSSRISFQTATLQAILQSLQAVALGLQDLAAAVQEISRRPASPSVDRSPPGPQRPFRPRMPIHPELN